MHFSLPPFLLALLTLSPAADSAKTPKNAILLSEVRSLTLRDGKSTTHRRVPALPQLKCVSNKKICALHTVDVMRCQNQGAGYTPEDIQWSCTASLPSTLKLGGTEVMCEGYTSADDPYVLRGSCGVEYRLVLTEEGERKYPDLAGGGGSWTGGETDWAGYLFGILFVAVLAWIVWGACTAARAPQPGRAAQRPRRGWGGGGGGGFGPGGGGGGLGGGPGGFDEPPPPYPGTKPEAAGAQGWRPGFWTGLAGGAAATYMAGNRNRNNPGRNNGGGLFGNNRNNDAGWFGNNNDNADYGSTWGSGRTRSGGSSSSGSSARHESTGFGSTSRR